jgi:rhodanese-related sulfurtransferase
MQKIKDILFWIILLIVGTYILYTKGYILKNYKDILVTTAYNKMLVDTNITLLDVRTIDEIKEDGKIKNSILIPVQILEQNINKLEKFKNRKIFVYCRSGNRSVTASRILANHGYHPYNIEGGINAWKKANLPIE